MTDSEIITRLATGIHGWKVYAYAPEWNPLESWADVMEVVEILRQKCCFQLDTVGFTGKEWRCMIGWSDDPISVIAEAPTGQRAICLAALEVVAALEASRG